VTRVDILLLRQGRWSYDTDNLTFVVHMQPDLGNHIEAAETLLRALRSKAFCFKVVPNTLLPAAKNPKPTSGLDRGRGLVFYSTTPR